MQISLRNVQTRPSARVKLVLRRLQEAREERQVGLSRLDLRLRPLHDEVKPRDCCRNVVLCLLALIAAGIGRALQRLVVTQSREVEDLHGRGKLTINDVERPDNRRQAREGKSEGSQIDRLAVPHQPRVRLRQQGAQGLRSGDARQLFIRSRQLRLRARSKRHADGIADGKPERRRLRASADRQDEKKEGKSFRYHDFGAPVMQCNSPAPNDRSVSLR